MKKIFLTSLFFISAIVLNGQVKVYPADDGQFSIENLARYFVGRGVQISNVSFTGNKLSIGQFADKTKAIGIGKGIVLTTGLAKYAEGPNDVENSDFNSNGLDDSDLNELVKLPIDPTVTTNIAILEFDFLPLSDSIRFRAVYGSEEYNSNTGNSNLNWDDPFAVFLSEANSTIKKNIATFVGINGNEYVSIRNIHNGKEKSWGVPPNGPGVNENLFVFNPKFGPNMQYNGYTKVLSFKEKVNTCNKYHLKIAIADSKSEIFDSGVFIEQADFGEKAIVSSVPKSLADTIFSCKGDPFPILTINGVNTLNMQWYFNDKLLSNTTNACLATVSGEYKVKGTVSGTCFWSDSVNVRIGDKFLLDIQSNANLICKAQVVTINGILPNTLTGSTFEWFSASNLPFENSQLTQTLTVTSKVSPIYLTVRSDSGCVQTDSLTLAVNSAFFQFTAVPPAETLICKGTSTSNSLFANVKPDVGTDPHQLIWKNSANEVLKLIPNNEIFPALFSIKPSKSDTYTVFLKSQNGCKDSASFRINVDSVVFQKPFDPSICLGQSTALSTSGVNIATYSWRILGQLSTISAQNFVSVKPAVNTKYELTMKENTAKACIAKDTVQVKVNPLPNYSKSSDAIVCKGSSITLNVQNADSVYWKGFNIATNTLTYNVLTPNIIYFTAFTEFQCKKTDSIKVQVFPNYQNTLVGQNAICLGESVTVTSINAVSSLWVNEGVSGKYLIDNPSKNKVYTCVGFHVNNCSDTSFFEVRVNKIEVEDPNFLKAIHLAHLCPQKYENDTLVSPESPFFTYRWYKNDSLLKNDKSILPVNSPGKYTAFLSDSLNCSLSDSILVINQCDTIPIIPQIIIPNIITPNGDGYNETFEITALKILKETSVSLEIYNRWGSLVFSANEYANDWDGNNAPDGLYYYKLTIDKKIYSGWLLIAR